MKKKEKKENKLIDKKAFYRACSLALYLTKIKIIV